MGDVRSNDKKNRIIDTLFFALLLALATAVTFALFYRQCVHSVIGDGLYHSDMKAYILHMQGLESGYEFPYPVFFKLSAFFHLFAVPELAVALATTFLNSAAMVIVKLALNRYAFSQMQDQWEKRKWVAGILISLAAVSLFFVSMLFPPEGIFLPGIHHKYLGVFTANPFHNATYMAARPFTVLAFLWFAKLLDTYERGCGIAAIKKKEASVIGVIPSGESAGEAKTSLKDYLLFALFLLLATMTKPSFTLVFVGAAGLIMLWRLFRSKFKNFVPTLQLGLCFVPTFLDLLYQYKGVFVPTEGREGGVGFTFGKIWGLYCDNIPLALCIGVAFPLAVLVLNAKQLKTNTLFRLSWQVYLMGFVMAFFLYEKGFREPDFNFSWGYMCGIFFVFLGSVAVLLQRTFEALTGKDSEGGKKKILRLFLQWGPFLWHVVCGLYYFAGIFQGKMYY